MRISRAVLPFLLIMGCSRNPEPKHLDLLSAPPPPELRLNEFLNLRPAEGHHFNLEAPQDCAGLPFLTKTARKLRCQMIRPGDHRIKLGVCDDANSYCRFPEFTVRVRAPKGWTPEKAAASKTEVRQPPKGKHAPLPGFIENDPKRALAEAAAGKKLLLIDFYGVWCPPCNMLEEYVYKKEPFLTATGDMVRAALDADSDLSWDWKARFKVGGYPTLIVADHELREIGRFVGNTSLGSLVGWIKTQKSLAGEPIEETLTLPPTPARRKRIGLWRQSRGEHERAAEALLGLKDPEARKAYLQAARRVAALNGDKDAASDGLKALIEEFPQDVSFAGRVAGIHEADPGYAMARRDAAFRSLKRWHASPKLTDTGLDRGDLYYDEAALWELSEDKDKAKAAYSKAADFYGELAKGSSLATARAANMSRGYMLQGAGRIDEAKVLYEELAASYPEEFTFYYGYAKVLKELKELDKGYAYAGQAVERAYGDNWLRAVALKAKFELAMDRKQAAAATIESALEEAVIPRSPDVRTHAYIADLRKLLAEARTTGNRP